MSTIIRKNLHIVGKGKFLALFLGCILFGISGRVNTALTYEQHILSAMTDHYYLIYFMIPLYLLVCFSVIEDDGEIVVMRYCSYFRYFLSKWASIAILSALFMGIQLLAVLLSGIGLPPGNRWILSEDATQTELFSVLLHYFSSPVSCFVVTTLYMLLGLCISGIFCMWIAHFLPKSWASKALMIFYIFTAASIKMPFLQELPITGFNHWIILHHNLTGGHRFLITAITTLCVVILILWTVKKYWHWQLTIHPKKIKGLAQYYFREAITIKNLLIMIVISSITALWKYIQNPNAIMADEWIVRLFAGHGTGIFHILSFLEMLIANSLPLYLLAIFIERVTSSHSIFVMARLKTRYELLNGILKTAFMFTAFYGLLFIVIPGIGISVLNLQTTAQTIPLLLSCIGLKLLDIMMQFLLMMALYCLTKQITIGFLVLVVLNLLCILPGWMSKYLPFGLSSISRIYLPQTQNGISVFEAYGILIIMNCIIFIWLRIYGHKKLLNN